MMARERRKSSTRKDSWRCGVFQCKLPRGVWSRATEHETCVVTGLWGGSKGGVEAVSLLAGTCPLTDRARWGTGRGEVTFSPSMLLLSANVQGWGLSRYHTVYTCLSPHWSLFLPPRAAFPSNSPVLPCRLSQVTLLKNDFASILIGVHDNGRKGIKGGEGACGDVFAIRKISWVRTGPPNHVL